MHKFSRGEPPIVMATAKADYHNEWGDFIGSDEHIALGDSLYERQSHFCAYCELKISQKDDGHIEHLERRSDKPERTFDWTNMFFSCNYLDSCGDFKDNTKQQFTPSDIVDPSIDDPLDFFVYGVNGVIYAKDSNKHRAEETIRVFNLNNPRLTNMRTAIAETVVSFIKCNPSNEQIEEFLQYMSNYNFPSVCYSLLSTSRT